jgi:protein TonB
VILKTQTMNHHFNSEQGMTEIIFAHRNKTYGAYQIRSSYGETTLKSLGIMLLCVCALTGTAFHLAQPEDKGPEEKTSLLLKDSVFVIPITLEEEPLPKTESSEKPASSAGAETTASSSTLVSDSALIEKPTSNSSPSYTTSTTETGAGNNSKGTGDTTLVSKGTISAPTVKNGFEVDQMPRFKGGLKALNDFIRSKVIYPETAVEDNRSGTVFVRFVVDENGKVVNAELLNKLGPDLNNEALRVIQMIPDFEAPGYSKGEPVKTFYQLPIHFRLR